MVHVKVLIVDDNAPMRAVVRSILADLDCRVRECADGAAALDAVRAWSPDWVVMDVRMPVLDGITAARRMRDEFPATRVVIISIHDAPELREAAAAAGARCFLPKRRLLDLPRTLEAE